MLMSISLAMSLGVVLMLLALIGSPQSSRAAFPAGDAVTQPWEPSATITLTRGPYLQSVTTDSIVVVWETGQLATSQVEYGPTVTYSLGVGNILPLTHHAIMLAGLDPYTVYHYQISSNGQSFGKDNTFRTAAAPTQTVFSFVAFGDTRTDHAAHQSVISRIVTALRTRPTFRTIWRGPGIQRAQSQL